MINGKPLNRNSKWKYYCMKLIRVIQGLESQLHLQNQTITELAYKGILDEKRLTEKKFSYSSDTATGDKPGKS